MKRNMTFQEEFFKQYSNRYIFIETLGEGDSANTFKATDILRRVDVCIKIFKNGHAPSGEHRDWRITSTIKHPQIADTFTVEEYESSSISCRCCAVISRFIPGKNLETFLEKLNSENNKTRDSLTTRLLSEFFPSLCEAVSKCHSHNYGHGDLTERNVIVNADLKLAQSNLAATLIDFDNAWNKEDLLSIEEEEKMQSDLRLLSRILGCIAENRRWYRSLEELLKEATNIDEYAFLFNGFISFTNNLLGKPKEYILVDFIEFHTSTINSCLNGSQIGLKLRESVRAIAKELKVEEMFTTALDTVATRLSDVNNTIVEVTMFEMKADEEQFLIDILRQKDTDNN